MKHLLMSILLTFSAYASADALIMNNQAGGKIVLTDAVCHLEGGEKFGLAYTWSSDSDLKIKGCWIHENGIIFVLWEGPSGMVEKTYELKNFKFEKTI